MAIRKVVQIGDLVLRQVAKQVVSFDDRLHTLIDDMIDTMFEQDGVGLAANQIGVLKRVFVVSPEQDKVFEFVNPVIVNTKGTWTFEEGCLSVLGTKGYVERPSELTIVAQDRYGKEFEMQADGLLARIILHEYDHLDGILFVDKTIKPLHLNEVVDVPMV
ncbi:MAG: peptide deformylase [Clostridiales bacterium]|jgi:peptide deformylase|nr:peptide deformylase [Clostridiales bacterium]